MPSSRPITRRQFFATFAPDWLNRTNILRVLKFAAVAIGSSCLVAFIRNIGLINAAAAAGLVLSGFSLMFFIAILVEKTGTLLQNSPRAIRATVTVLLRLTSHTLVAISAILLYRRWESGKEMLSIWISLAIMLWMQISTEIQQTTANNRQEQQQG